MTTTSEGLAVEISDAELVAESLAGRRDAFCEIVERHKTLVCSIAYCATGSLAQSEDLAQETFLAAWRQLAELRDPSRLRPWLCGIARCVIGKELRRRGRDPVHEAATLDAVNDMGGSEPLPSDRAINEEEQAILWRCVASIPEIYREPLVLFYREHQSIERVAEALELTEDAVKQRLARGRKMLQEKALAYVEGALQSTNPGCWFTLGVLAALPLSATSAKALTFGAALKGSSTLKTFAALAAVGAVILFYSLLGFLAFAGACAGYWMSQASLDSVKQRENVIRFWRTLVWGYAICFIARQLLFSSVGFFNPSHYTLGVFPPWFLMRLCLDLFYVVIVGALAVWVRRWWKDVSIQRADSEEFPVALKRRFAFWLSLGMIVPVCWFVPIVGGFLWQTFGPETVRHLSDAEFETVIKEKKFAFAFVMESEDGSKILHVNDGKGSNDPGSSLIPKWWKHWAAGNQAGWWNLWNNGTEPRWLSELFGWSGWRPVQLLAAADETNLGLLKEKGNNYGTGRMGRADAWPFGALVPYFVAPMGFMMVLRLMRKRSISTTENRYDRTLMSLRGDPETERIFRIVFAMTFLLIFAAHAFMVTRSSVSVGLYFILFAGSIKGAFFGLIMAVGVLYLRTYRRAQDAPAKI